MLFDDEYTAIYHFCKAIFEDCRSNPHAVTISRDEAPAPLGKIARQLKGYGFCVLSFSETSLTVCL